MTIEELSSRLEKVERQNRRMKAAVVVGLTLVAGVAAMGQAVPDRGRLVARELVLSDREGKEHLWLEVSEGGVPSLRMSGSDRKDYLLLTVLNGNEPCLRMANGTGGYIGMGAPRSGAASISIRNGSKDADINNGPTMGMSIWADGTQAWGSGLLPSKPLQFLLMTSPEGTTALEMRDKDGKVIERLPK